MSIHTKTAIEAIKRSPFQAISAIFVLALTFFVATTVAILVYASNKSLSYFETRPQIIAFLKDDTKADAISALQNKLTIDFRVKDVRFVPKEEALAIYKKATEDNPLLAELVSPSIFPASLEFSVTDLNLAEKIIEEIRGEAIVDQVGFTANLGGEKSLSDVVTRLKTISYYLRLGGIVFVGILGATSFLVLLVIISMRMTSRKGEIEILSLIGATPKFVRSPIVLEGIIYALVGVVAGWTVSFILWLYVSPSIISYFGQIPILPKNPISFFLLFAAILGAELLIGFTLALIGSLVAVKRSLKKAK
ncbi:MAG: permease-like cell division protein FtsX [Candidatus Woesebacteria bacterium]|nr:permease-like cell division protein FtsX [Candidatus Woesebacteria bacterium]